MKMDSTTTILEKPEQAVDPPLIIARLLCGFPADSTNYNDLGDVWKPIATAVLSANGKDRYEAFESALKGISDAEDIRKAVFAVQPNNNGQPAGEIEDGGDDVSIFEQNVDVPELPKSARIPDSLAREAQDTGCGLNAYIDFAIQASPMTPSIFHEAFGLTILAAAVARRLCLRVSSTTLFPNLYTMIIAPSTLYRKTTGAKVAEQVLNAAGLRSFLLPTRMTPESFLQELTGQKTLDFDKWQQQDQEEWKKERLFAGQRAWFIDEISSLFDSFDLKHASGLLPLILDLFDCPESKSDTTISRGRHTIRSAYLSICGATTPAALKPHLAKPDHWLNGLWARCALITPNEKPKWQFWPDEVDIPNSLIERLHNLAFEKLPVPKSDPGFPIEGLHAKSMILSPIIWEYWEAYAKALEHNLLISGVVHPKLHASYGRFATMAIKVAMLLATADWMVNSHSECPEIGLAHWAKAQLIVESWRASLHRLIESPALRDQNDSLEERIIQKINATPSGLSARELATNLGMTKPSDRKEIDRTITIMQKNGRIEPSKRKSTRGPSANAWILKTSPNDNEIQELRK